MPAHFAVWFQQHCKETSPLCSGNSKACSQLRASYIKRKEKRNTKRLIYQHYGYVGWGPKHLSISSELIPNSCRACISNISYASTATDFFSERYTSSERADTDTYKNDNLFLRNFLQVLGAQRQTLFRGLPFSLQNTKSNVSSRMSTSCDIGIAAVSSAFKWSNRWIAYRREIEDLTNSWPLLFWAKIIGLPGHAC